MRKVLPVIIMLAACGNCGGSQSDRSARWSAAESCVAQVIGKVAAQVAASRATGQKASALAIELSLVPEEIACVTAVANAKGSAESGSAAAQ